MSGTYTNLKYHLIWSTENRNPFIKEKNKNPLYEYIAGMIRKMDGVPDLINGTTDHLHLLLGLHQTVSVAEAVQKIKANSSNWFKNDAPDPETKFQWQSGYAAFTVSQSRLNEVYDYIDNQEEHHRTVSFREEYKQFLDVNQIDFNEEYIL